MSYSKQGPQLVGILLVSFIYSSLAQNISVSKIEENRSTDTESFFGNRCTIFLDVTGNNIQKFTKVRISKLTTLVDEVGNSLLLEDEDNDFDFEDVREEGASLKIKIKSAPRSVNVIASIVGELFLYGPSESNGGIVKVSNYQSKKNVNLLPPNLPLKIIYVDKKSFEKYKQENTQKREENLSKLPATERKAIEDLLTVLDDLFTMEDNANTINLYVSGDHSKLADYYFEDSQGERKEFGSSSKYNNTFISLGMSEEIKPQWKLVFELETTGSVKNIPFTIKNTKLP